MKNINLLKWISFGVTIFSSCQVSYRPDLVKSSQQIPVIQGFITNQPGPYLVNLTWASGFNATNTILPITGATVTISDDAGTIDFLTEKNPGNYYTDSAKIRGIAGRKYTLRVKLTNGDLYESRPTILNFSPSEFDIYAQIGTKNVVSTDAYGGFVVNNETGLFIKTNAGFQGNYSKYLRFSSKVIIETMYQIYSSSGSEPYPYYTWSVSDLTDLPDVELTIPDSSKQMVVNHVLGFVENHIAVLPPPITLPNGNIVPDTISAPSIQGWIVSTNLYSINNDAYSYYQAINNQLSSNNQIFDPVASKIIGNIICKNDSTKPALGLFEVASVLTRHDGFYWEVGMKDYNHMVIQSFTDTVMNGHQKYSPPPFWIDMSEK